MNNNPEKAKMKMMIQRDLALVRLSMLLLLGLVILSCGNNKDQDDILKAYDEICNIYSADKKFDRYKTLEEIKPYYSTVYLNKLKQQIELAKNGTREEIEEFSIGEQIEILKLRLVEKKSYILGGHVDSILLYRQLGSLLVFGQKMKPLRSNVLKDKGMVVFKKVESYHIGYDFYRENNRWKIDLNLSIKLNNKLFELIPRKFPTSETDFILEKLNLKNENEIPWEPLT